MLDSILVRWFHGEIQTQGKFIFEMSISISPKMFYNNQYIYHHAFNNLRGFEELMKSGISLTYERRKTEDNLYDVIC